MDVLIVLVFVSLLLVCGGVLLLFVALHQRDFEHAERLSLLPLEDETEHEAALETDRVERPNDSSAWTT